MKRVKRSLSANLVRELDQSLLQVCSLATLSIFAIPELSFAGGGAGGHKGSIADLMWPWVNFSLYVILIFVLLKGVVSKGWLSRAERIEADATRGEKALQTAATELAAAKERMARLPTEKASLVKGLNTEANAEAKKTISDAELRAQEIERQAAARITAEKLAAIQAIRRSVAERVITTTEEKVRSGISLDADQRLRNATAQSISELKRVAEGA
jgi:F0F1-type ATP synthase membrane subunit b/b'